MYYFILVFIMVILFWGLFSLIGNTSTWPKTWAFISLVFGAAWAFIIDSTTNFTTFYLIPVGEIVTGARVPSTFDFSAMLVVGSMLFATVMALRTSIISFGEEGKLNIFYNDPGTE